MKSREDDLVFELFPRNEWRTSGAYFWDDYIENLPEWRELRYTWIASSRWGDQIIVTDNSPLHVGTALYMHGPDVAGPIHPNPAWIENIIYLGPSIDAWLARVQRFGDEYSIVPGSIDEHLGSAADEYRTIYRQLNPGLQW
ncbi:hypothetical protein [Anatilimnocola floriformis]|uniref:hypothetical protein n=1 Tax=Anatilimnocola floriformis TaxID=2948575 RepID=UPI0020C4B92D|nr:hypothetical protein [Anatilimnocola floriformis]